MKTKILFTMICISIVLNTFSQAKNSIILLIETEEIIIKVESNYFNSCSFNIKLEAKRDILIPILYNTTFFVDDRLFKYDEIFIYFPYNMETTGIDLKVNYKLIKANTIINEKVVLQEFSNTVRVLLSYNYVNDKKLFSEIIENKSLCNYFTKMKWGTIEVYKDL